MHIYQNDEGVFCMATEVRLLLTEEALAGIEVRAKDGDDLAKMILGGIVKEEQEPYDPDEDEEDW